LSYGGKNGFSGNIFILQKFCQTYKTFCGAAGAPKAENLGAEIFLS